jgi:chromosome transmission fidelity protein 1
VILLKELSVYSTQWSAAAKPGHTEIITVGNLLSRLGKNVDGINLLEITDYLRKSRIARKINGYAEKAATKARQCTY